MANESKPTPTSDDLSTEELIKWMDAVEFWPHSCQIDCETQKSCLCEYRLDAIKSAMRGVHRTLIPYNQGTPVYTGVYACRLCELDNPAFLEDAFLMWHDGEWSYLRSDQRCRREVLGWIGPLQRKIT
jgi:hypothetical protein